MARPNVLFILADQLRASSLPAYGMTQIETPHLDRLASEGAQFQNAISTCPVCTPYRSMLLTGRHPQTTGHLCNFVRTRHDEISLADAFNRSGYRTGWIGKWHLHTGSFPVIGGPDYVPEGRDRLGFQYWRGYNFHADYFNGSVNRDDWRVEHWEGYETDALAGYAREFMGAESDEPFCCFVSPHQPHMTGGRFAPEHYYERLPDDLTLPDNVPIEKREALREHHRNYLAMTLALDDMTGQLLDYLDERNLTDSTIVIFTSDHGTMGGAHGINFWNKKEPYEESILVPFFMRYPGPIRPGAHNGTLFSAADLMPSLCSLCDVPVPRSVEGCDMSDAWLGRDGARQQDGLLLMDFSATYDWLKDGHEWRGLRTMTHTYARRLSGKEELYNNEADPLQMTNLAQEPGSSEVRDDLRALMESLMRSRYDELVPCTDYADWFDAQRRVIRNAHGPMSDPEGSPDWSLLMP